MESFTIMSARVYVVASIYLLAIDLMVGALLDQLPLGLQPCVNILLAVQPRVNCVLTYL